MAGNANLKMSVNSIDPTSKIKYCTLNFRATFHDTQTEVFTILDELISVCKKHRVDFISTDLNDPKDTK